MKTKLSILTISIFFSQFAFAQFDIGFKLGANVSKIEGQSFKDEFKYGYHLGGFAEIGLGKKISIQPEVLFNQYQTTVDSSFRNVYTNAFNFSDNRDIKLNYLSIPLLLNYKLGNAFALQAGPQFGILLDSDKNLLENGKEAFNKGDFSMLGGAQLSISRFRIMGRYFAGLNNLNDVDDQRKWKNQGFQVSLGIGF